MPKPPGTWVSNKTFYAVKKKLANNPQNAFPGKGCLKAADQELRQAKRELERVEEERDILKKRWPTLRRIRNEIPLHLYWPKRQVARPEDQQMAESFAWKNLNLGYRSDYL